MDYLSIATRKENYLLLIIHKFNLGKEGIKMRPIKDYEDYLINEDGTIIYSTKLNRNITIIKQEYNHEGRVYICPVVRLTSNNVRKKHVVSRLVYKTFVGEIPNGYQIDHKDNNPENNHFENLQILTARENSIKRSYDNNKKKIGFCKGVRRILCIETGNIYESQGECAAYLNIRQGNLSSVLSRT